jgi:hypothetical protein
VRGERTAVCLLERGSRLTGSEGGARWKPGQVRCRGAADLRSWCAYVWCRNSKRCSTVSLRELRGASARCGSLLGARVGREHSNYRISNVLLRMVVALR